MKTLTLATLLLIFAGVSRADSIWQYQGNEMAGCACAITGTVTLDANNQAIAWNFTLGDGIFLDQTDSVATIYTSERPGTHPLFETWRVDIDSIDSLSGFFFSEFYGSAFEATDYAWDGTMGGRVDGNHGVWQDAVATPEPGTLLLVGVGLAGLLLRKRKKPVDLGQWEPLA